MKETKELEVFRSAPVHTAVLKAAVPSMAAMVMILVYNLADTFFIGLTRDAYQVASVSMAMPVYMMFMAFGIVFGIGGTSVISRSLGEGKREYARRVCSFCMWGCVAVGIVLALIFYIFMDQLLYVMGASPETYDYVRTYLIIVSISGPFVLIANCFSNVVRAEGQSSKAMMGMVLGNFVNIILDPIMISGLGWGVKGAAIATTIGHIISGGYYVVYFFRGKSILSISLKDFSIKDGIFTNVVVIGAPAALGHLLTSISQIILNGQMTAFGDMAVAGIGVAGKVMMITGTIGVGMGQGVQPLLGYCYGAKLMDRFKSVIRFSILFAFALSTTLAVLCFVFTKPIAGVFLTQPEAFEYAFRFIRIMLTTSIFFGMFYILTNTLQAAGKAKAALIVNISRQGIVYIPALFILGNSFGANGLTWAQPVADVISMIMVIILSVLTFRNSEFKQLQ